MCCTFTSVMKHLFTSAALRFFGVLGFALISVGAKPADYHKFYHSFTIVRENVMSNTIEVEMKFFTDDLEHILEQKFKPDFNLGGENELDDADRYIQDYLRTNFSLAIDDRPLRFSFIGKDVENDITWCYLEYIRPPSINTITVTNSSLMDLFEGQKNEVDFRFNGWTKRVALTEGHISETVFN